MKKIYYLIVIVLIGLQACKTQEKKRPNVLLILTDNQSFYELSRNGHQTVKTPNIDKFADEGLVLGNFYASPYCSPSRAELLTGRYALRYGIHNTIGGVSILNKNEKLLAGYLKDAGYVTGVFGKWHLGNEYPYHPKFRGFDETFVHDGGGIGQLPDYFANSHIDAVYNNNGKFERSSGFSTDVLFQQADSFIKKNSNKPFFCFISTPATHAPWQAHPTKLKELEKRGVAGSAQQLALYSMIENVDDNVGKILTQLESLGLDNETLVIIATDQGMDYRGMNNPPNKKNQQWSVVAMDKRHKVFCMMRYPDLITKPYETKALTSIVDLAPTILDVCGLQSSGNMDGISLRPLFSKMKDWVTDREVIVQCPRQREREKFQNASVKTKKWRLVEGKYLFDAVKDPFQEKDIAEQFPNVVDSINSVYNNFWNSLKPFDELLPRNYIGAEEAPETRLVAMDWYKGDWPWRQVDLKQKEKNGTWPLEVVNDGSYRFELYRYPREEKHPIEAVKASVFLDEQQVGTKEIDTKDESVSFTLKLKKGKYDFKTLFEGQSGEEWGALFVYAKSL